MFEGEHYPFKMKHLCFGLFICLLGIEYSYGWVNNMQGKYAKQNFVPTHAISVIIAYAQSPLTSINAAVSSRVKRLNFRLHPYFVNASSEGSGESAHMLRLA